MKSKKEKRQPILCPFCQTEMVCMNRFESITDMNKGFYAWYICPRRKGEKGCGYHTLLQVFPEKKLPSKAVFSVRFKTIRTKRK